MENRAWIRQFVGTLGSIGLLVSLAACAASSESNDETVSQLSTPSSTTLTGFGTSQAGSTNYLFATAAGTVDASGNLVTSTFSDPNLPLELNSTSAYSQVMSSGSCNTLGTLYASIAGSTGNQVTTQLSATGCSDQAVITVSLDTTQLFDSYGFEGAAIDSFNVTVDLAPLVSTAATGYSSTTAGGTTESSAGYFTLASDKSIVVNFDKSITSGTYDATLSGCSATLGAPFQVTATSVAWPLNNLPGSPGGTCSIDVNGVTDGAGNADDAADPNQSMTITFH